MRQAPAYKVAIDLMHFPSQVRTARLTPPPDDVLTLLRIVSGDEKVTNEVAELTRRSPDTVREAAAFFIEQILLYPGADSYRVLGAQPEATYSELRRNMALLLRWLHPDRDRQEGQAIYTARVTRAWSDLKTQERRRAYDRLQRKSLTDKSLTRKSLIRKKGGTDARSNKVRLNQRSGFGRHGIMFPDNRRGLLQRILLLFFGRVTL